MTKQRTSELYAFSTLEIHRLTTELYENLHNEDGTPRDDWETVLDLTKTFRKKVGLEVDAIKWTCQEYNELKNPDAEDKWLRSK
jgi:predicted translin family RNA/ssDNA-binding protein